MSGCDTRLINIRLNHFTLIFTGIFLKDSSCQQIQYVLNKILFCVMSYTFLAYLALWHPVLKEVNDAQIFLQTRGLGLDCCATTLVALVLFCQKERENVVETAKTKVTSFCEENGIPTEKRVRRRRRMVG